METLSPITPRKPELIIREINELMKVIEHTQSMMSQFPTDRLLQLASEQDQFRKKQLMKELHLSLMLYLYYMA
ncbi:MAG: hypothetical protein MUE81_17440 [Thermoflexibacter sp.]|nr:hypothetical protein [Thermoflexibacter sp.]